MRSLLCVVTILSALVVDSLAECPFIRTSDPDDCFVNIKFIRGNNPGFGARMKCNDSRADYDLDGPRNHRNSFVNRFRNIDTIVLNGCEVNGGDTLNVDYVPDPVNVKHLTLEYFSVGVLEAHTFSKFVGMESLTLISNGIESLQDNVFIECKQLRTLTIQEKNLHLSDGLFVVLRNLENLHIQASSYCANDFTMLPSSLRSLRIESTKVLNAHLMNFKSVPLLEHLRLSDCDLAEIYFYQKMNNLLSLNLSGNRLAQLGREFLSADKLVTLDLSSNKLDYFRGEVIAKTPSLAHLNISHNSIEDFSFNNFDNCPKLSDIDVRFNDLALLKNANDFRMSDELQIKVDGNHFDCVPLKKLANNVFAHLNFQPETEHLNVHGLKCFVELLEFDLPTDSPSVVEKVEQPVFEIAADSEHPNWTVVAALVIAFCLFAVVVIQITLIMYYKHQRDQHVPFYRTLPEAVHFRRNGMAATAIFHRTLPPTGYESPLRENTADASDDLKNFYEEIQNRMVYDKLGCPSYFSNPTYE